MSNRKLLDYHDVLLYYADAELLLKPNWLNDQASRSCHPIILESRLRWICLLYSY